MKNRYKYYAMSVVSLFGLTLASCGDDDDPKGPENSGEPTTENVFTEGLPTNVNGATFTTNEKGQLTKIVDGSTNYTFEYGSFNPSRAHNFTVLLKVRDSHDPDDGSDVYMEINERGFASYAYQIYLDPEDGTDEWWFEYNNDGQLSSLKRSESSDNFKITYVDGDITKVVQDDGDGDHHDYVINYTNGEYEDEVANKGCVMLFDDFFQIDMDEVGIAYFAGLLGKSTKNLPMGYSEKVVEDGVTNDYGETYHWVFNANKLPTKFWRGNREFEAVTFTW